MGSRSQEKRSGTDAKASRARHCREKERVSDEKEETRDSAVSLAPCAPRLGGEGARGDSSHPRAMVFQVGGTKKGGMPVTTEKRPRGKTVTVIGNVKGDKEELIRLLKSRLGCGGHAAGHDRVEIQGEHASAIQDLLLKHGGSGTMKGVAGLKAPEEARRTDRRGPDETDAEAERTRRATGKRAARESRQRAMKEAVLVKPESARSFHAFCAMMKRWRYWDQDYDRLHEMHHRHLRELRDGPSGKNTRRFRGALGASFLDADDLDDNERLQNAPRSAVLETMRENLGKLDVETRPGSSASAASAYEQLRALGMIAEPSPFRQTREERLAESRRNAAEARVRALNEARIQAARRKQAIAGLNGAVSNAASERPFGGYRPRVRKAAGASAKRGKGDASRPTLGFTAARKRGSLAHARALGYPRDENDDDEASESDEDQQTFGGDRDETAAATTTTAAASWDSTPGFRRNVDGGFSFGPVEGSSATPAWAREAAGEASDAVSSDAAPRAREETEALSLEELDLREALRLSLLEAERPPRRQAGLHVECGDVWGDLTEEEALALAMELSEQDETRRLREERDAYEAGSYGGRDSEDDFEEARSALAETPNEISGFSEFSEVPEARERADPDADLAEALRLSALESENERLRASERRARASLMPEAMDEDAALREALRRSALESERASARASTPVSPRGANETACLWAAEQLGAFTGEVDNSVLAEYVVSMSRAEVEEFLGESFGDAEAAKVFARALEEMR